MNPKIKKISIIIPTLIDGSSILLLTNCLAKLLDHRDLRYLYELIVLPNNWDGFSKPVNVGIQNATGEYILIMNDDVEVLNYGWEDIMTNMFQDDTVGIVAYMETIQHEKYSAMWFTMIKKEVFDKVGLLDENMNYFMQDMDFGLRARKAGYRTEFVKLNINHKKCQTTSRLQNHDELMKKDREYFEKKWDMKVDDL